MAKNDIEMTEGNPRGMMPTPKPTPTPPKAPRIPLRDYLRDAKVHKYLPVMLAKLYPTDRHTRAEWDALVKKLLSRPTGGK